MARVINGYIAGSFYDKTIGETRKELAKQIRNLDDANTQFNIYNPIENCDSNSEYDCKQLFKNTNVSLDKSDFVILDLTDHDARVLLELGRITTLLEKTNSKIKLYVLWKIDLNGKKYIYAVNRYIRGAVEKHSRYYESENEIINQIKKDFL